MSVHDDMIASSGVLRPGLFGRLLCCRGCVVGEVLRRLGLPLRCVRELGRVGATIAAASSSCSRASTFASSALAFARSASTVSCASFTTAAFSFDSHRSSSRK